MKKETIIAIILGILFGGVLAIFIFNKNKQEQLEKTKPIAPTKKEERLTKERTQIKLQSFEIEQPKDGSIFDKSEITIVGRAAKDSLVVIQSPIKDLAFKTKDTKFSVNFPLALGENVIKLVIYPSDQRLSQQEKELRVYYLKEEL